MLTSNIFSNPGSVMLYGGGQGCVYKAQHCDSIACVPPVMRFRLLKHLDTHTHIYI